MQLKIVRAVPLKRYSTMGVGGEADYFVEVRSVDEMIEALKFCKREKIRYLVIGKGSNLLFDDRGFDGMVILNKIDFIKEEENGIFHVGAGYNFSLLGVQTARKGWSGLEFASGIPGTVGGAVYMNAGANGGETVDSLLSVDYIDDKGKERSYKSEELSFSYRSSPFQKMKGAIVGASFQLTPSEEARKKQISIVNYRKETQPYGDRSCGCIFRNPPSSNAGRLIEEAGLKGMKIGGAEVSTLHANFIVNREGATASEIAELIAAVKRQVALHAGVDLCDELRIIPYKEEE